MNKSFEKVALEINTGASSSKLDKIMVPLSVMKLLEALLFKNQHLHCCDFFVSLLVEVSIIHTSKASFSILN